MNWYHVAKTFETVVSCDVLADSEEEAIALSEGEIEYDADRVTNEDIYESNCQISAEAIEEPAH